MISEAELKKEVRMEIGMRLGRSRPTRKELETLADKIFDASVSKYGVESDGSLKDAVIGSICDDFLGLGPIQKLMDDDTVTEIMVNGPFQIYAERRGEKKLCDDKFDNEDHLRSMVEKMLSPSGRRVDESSPYVDFSLPDGSRVNVIIPPLSVGGSVVTIRKFLETIRSVDDLVRLETVDIRMAEFLKAAIRSKCNILFSGATGSGKTSTLGVLSTEIPVAERIVTIEDALELQLSQDHVVRLLTRTKNIEGKGEVSVRNLFQNVLRMRPSRILLGEIRGEEAMDFLQAVNSGHDGTLAVLHASTPQNAIGRLETMATYSGLNIPSTEIRRQIASGLHLIVQHEQMSDGSRKITFITEIQGVENGDVKLNNLYRYEIEDIGTDGKVSGGFHALGKPALLSRFKKFGVTPDESIFE
jgi:pilus assembly protein CpaF